MMSNQTMENDALEKAAKATEALYITRDTYFPADPDDKISKLKTESDLALNLLDSIPPEQRKHAAQSAMYKYLRGKILDVLPEYKKEAEDHLSKAVKLNPSISDAWLCLGNCIWKKGDLSAAKNIFTSALSKGPNKQILCQLSMLERKMAQGTDNQAELVEESIRHAKEAISLDVKDGNSWYNLGNACLTSFFVTGAWDHGKLQQSLKAYQNAEKDERMSSNPDMYFNCATTLERSYLLKVHGKVVERPQHMLMRVSVGIHKDDIDSVIKTYHLMSQRWFTHASPTLFNSGTPRPQLSSCFLVCMKDDSIEGIYDTLKECAVISKSAGGIGVSVHNIRATGSYIRGTNGTSNGIIPMLRVFNDTARYVDQGGGKRKGAFAVYLEPWHADIFDFLELRKNHGKEEQRARDLFYALWVPDLFMERVENNGDWSLFCPSESPGLADCWGEKFEQLYTRYEREGKAKKVVPAQQLWFEVLKSQIETGTPYMLFKDTCNRKSNQQNLGTIKCSNLCTEIVEYTSPTETAVCNLASIALPRFVREKGVPVESHPSKLVGSKGSKNRFFDFDKLAEVTSIVTTNLNKIIDVNYYPVESAKTSNLRHRPIGIGVQGLADTFILLGMSFDSPEAQQLNKDIFETIYYNALKASSELAAKEGTYETYNGCPVSKGILQPDMWDAKPSDRWDWGALREMISRNGVRNSLLVAPMPTASTSQILGNNECFEPYTSNIYSRRVLSGEFVVVNKHLLYDLTEMGLWSPAIKNKIIYEDGSVQKIPQIPDDLKAIYRTVWEIKQRTLVDMAVDRGCYIDQSQSLNIHMDQPNFGKLTSLHFYAWRQGLKTGMYYLRSRAAADAIKFTVDTASLKEKPNEAVVEDNNAQMEQMVCSLANREECMACGS